MAPKIQDLVIELNFKDAGSQRVINQIRSSLSGLEDRLTTAAPKVASLRKEILAQGKASRNTASNLKLQASALTALRDEARLGSTTFKQLTADIERLNGQLAKAEGRKKGGAGRLQGLARTAGAIAAGGVFGGAEGTIGGAIGGALGGFAGAATGAAIGAQIGQLRQALGATAAYSANLSKLRIALQGVTTSQEEYTSALSFIQETTEKFAIPQEIVTRQFTKLQASVQGAGGNLEDTKKVFEGIVASVRATGGSLADVDSALTASAQVFSKGKVSAEELRQQIGERLPGAFTLFAESMDKTPAALDKALERGEVTLEDFLRFSSSIFDRYGKNAETIASSPAAAGDRLKVTLERLSENVGTLLAPVGAAFQDIFNGIAREISKATAALARFFNLSFDPEKLARAQADLEKAEADILNSTLVKDRRGAEKRLRQAQATIARQIQLRDAGTDIKRPEQGTGFAGGAGSGGGAAETIKDITEAQAAAQIKAIQNRTKGIELTKEAIAKEAELARVAAQKVPPNKKSVELARIAQKEAGQLNKLQQDELKIANNVAKAKLDLSELLAKAKGEQGLLNEKQVQQELNQIKVNELMLKYNVLVEEGVIKQEDLRKKLEEAVAALNKAQSPLESFRSGLQKVFEEAMNLNEALATTGVQAVQQFGDAFADFVATGKASFADLTRSILQDLSRIFARAALFKGLSLIPGVGNFLGLGGGGVGGSTGLNVEGIAAYMNAKGNIYAKNKIVPFAYGGIVKKPTLFPMANGAGLMGEAGPEAIMPLRRGRDGKLGVEASGGVGNVVVNVDASGSRVQGDQPNAKALGSAIGAAVQAEIVRQKRPGGLLS